MVSHAVREEGNLKMGFLRALGTAGGARARYLSSERTEGIIRLISSDWASDEEYGTVTAPDIEEVSKDLRSLKVKINRIEREMAKQTKLLMALSQAYYWSAEWQAKEQRAERELEEELGTGFASPDELIEFLHTQ